jgi:hypothetical protein
MAGDESPREAMGVEVDTTVEDSAVRVRQDSTREDAVEQS